MCWWSPSSNCNVRSRRQRQHRLGLSISQMNMIVIGGDRLIQRHHVGVDQHVMVPGEFFDDAGGGCTPISFSDLHREGCDSARRRLESENRPPPPARTQWPRPCRRRVQRRPRQRQPDHEDLQRPGLRKWSTPHHPFTCSPSAKSSSSPSRDPLLLTGRMRANGHADPFGDHRPDHAACLFRRRGSVERMLSRGQRDFASLSDRCRNECDLNHSAAADPAVGSRHRSSGDDGRSSA